MTDALPFAVLDVLCPMHAVIDADGLIAHAGPTLRKLRPARDLVGQPLMSVLTVKRPRAITDISDLRDAAGMKLHLELCDAPQTALKGIMVPLGDAQGHMALNLSFGISIIDGVRDYALTNADFAATDLAIEMLYLVEAKTAAMEASRHLNLRLQGAKVAAEEQAYTDTLTGLKNRRALDMVLSRRVETDTPFAVMHIDLDYFKAVNDTLGHAAGDFVLQNVARIMVDETRASDTVARVGGDEFTLVLPEMTSEKIALRVGRRIIERLEHPMAFRGKHCHISASIGIVLVKSGERPDMAQLMADADLALYASKHAGRAQQTVFTATLRKAANLAASPTPPDEP